VSSDHTNGLRDYLASLLKDRYGLTNDEARRRVDVWVRTESKDSAQLAAQAKKSPAVPRRNPATKAIKLIDPPDADSLSGNLVDASTEHQSRRLYSRRRQRDRVSEGPSLRVSSHSPSKRQTSSRRRWHNS